MKIAEMSIADMLSINPNDYTTEELRELVKCLALCLADRDGVGVPLSMVERIKERR